MADHGDNGRVAVLVDCDNTSTEVLAYALQVVAQSVDERTAQTIQLALEYEPSPPFWSGTPHHAPAEIVTESRERMAAFMERRLEASKRAAAELDAAPKTAPKPEEPWLE